MRVEDFNETTLKEAFAQLTIRQQLRIFISVASLFVLGAGAFFVTGRITDEERWRDWPHVVAVSTSVEFGGTFKKSSTRTAFSYERIQDGRKFECQVEAISGGQYSLKRGLPYRVGERFEIAIDSSLCGSYSFAPEPPARTTWPQATALLITVVGAGVGLIVFLVG